MQQHAFLTTNACATAAPAPHVRRPARVPSVRVRAYVDANVKGPFPVKADALALFQPLKLGAVQLNHRVIMAPLTRNR